jgi:hypothetical protein
MSNGKIMLQISFQLFLIHPDSFLFSDFLLSPRQRHVEAEGETKERKMTIAGTMCEYIKFQLKDC